MLKSMHQVAASPIQFYAPTHPVPLHGMNDFDIRIVPPATGAATWLADLSG